MRAHRQFLSSFSCSILQILKYKGMLALYINYKMQDFPAQKMASHQERMNRLPSSSDLMTQTIRAKYDVLKSKAPIKYNMVRVYQPINMEKYNELVQEFKEFLEGMQEGQSKDIKKFMPLIFGVLQGSCSLNEPEDILVKRFGENIEKIAIDEIIKGKLKNVNIANDKRRQTNIREVSSKEAFESLAQFYDLKSIKNHRKIYNHVKSYLKSMKKFMEVMKNSEQNELFNESSPQNICYIEFANEEICYNKLKIPAQVLGIESEMNDEDNQNIEEGVAENLITPCKKETKAAKAKEETASCKKIEEPDNQENKSSSNQQNEQNKSKPKDNEGKQTRVRRTKQEIQKEKQAKQREKEQKLLEKERAEKQKLLRIQQKEKERLLKQKQKQAERQAKEKEREAKQRERQAKEREKQAERMAKQAERLAKQAERKAKEAAKEAERIAKEKKNNPGQSLKLWLKPTQHSSPQKNEEEDKVEVQETNTLENEKNNFLSSINSLKTEVSELRKMFLTQKMKNQTASFEPYYATVFTHKSRLEFNRFFINQERFKEYFYPHDQYQNGKYDDSSVEYQDFCGDFCDEKIDEMSDEDEEASFNSAIVPDSYISEDEISSLNESKDHIDVKIDQGAEWYFSSSNNYTADKYTMFCCFEDEPLPLPLNEPEQSNELSLTIKCELYKEIHGYYGPKDSLIKKLALITDKVPKSYLDTLIKETTTKRGYQRLVKPEIIDFLNQQRDTFAKQLEEIKNKRDEDNMIEMRGKMNEKEREIERLILEQAGTYYIIDMLHFLRERGFRMLKRELKEFIDARTGEVWDDVRKKMGRMQLKSKEKISPFLTKKDKENKAEGCEEIKEEKMEKDEKEEKVYIEEEPVQLQVDEKEEKKADQNNKEEKMQPEP